MTVAEFMKITHFLGKVSFHIYDDSKFEIDPVNCSKEVSFDEVKEKEILSCVENFNGGFSISVEGVLS